MKNKFDDCGFALQDLVNEVGSRLGFEVEHGKYMNCPYDGLWTSPEGRVIVVDESNPKCSLASEITSLISEKCFDDLKTAVIKITAPHTPVPFSPPMEDFYIPSTKKIIEAIKKVHND